MKILFLFVAVFAFGFSVVCICVLYVWIFEFSLHFILPIQWQCVESNAHWWSHVKPISHILASFSVANLHYFSFPHFQFDCFCFRIVSIFIFLSLYVYRYTNLIRLLSFIWPEISFTGKQTKRYTMNKKHVYIYCNFVSHRTFVTNIIFLYAKENCCLKTF